MQEKSKKEWNHLIVNFSVTHHRYLHRRFQKRQHQFLCKCYQCCYLPYRRFLQNPSHWSQVRQQESVEGSAVSHTRVTPEWLTSFHPIVIVPQLWRFLQMHM